MPLFLPSLSRANRLRSLTRFASLARTLSFTQNVSEPTNKHISVGPDGKVRVDFTSAVSEPLGLPAQDGYGWPQLEFNQTIGPDNRYVILRKLGWGMTSSTWLARDLQDNLHVAIKVLTGYSTGLTQTGHIWELGALKRLSLPPSSPHCLRLISNFTMPGKGSAGEHLCLVTQLLGGDVKSLYERLGRFPFLLAKRMLLHVLRGIVHAHSRGVVHTDLKHDNIFFDTCMSAEDFDKLLASDPPRRHPPEASYDGTVEAAVSQPLPTPTMEEAMKRNYVLADFGSAQSADIQLTREITPLALRPPEILIGGPWNLKVDIWTFGCLIFEFVTSRALFKYKPYEKYKLDETSYILYQMICYTGEDFKAEQLTVSPLAGDFFDSTCNLRANPPLFDHPFEKSIRSYKVIEEADVLSTAALMRRCLRLDPAQRASAVDLLSDPWFAGVD